MGDDATNAERAARVRAALAYKFPSGRTGVSIADQAKAIGENYPSANRRWRRLLSGDPDLFAEKADAIAAATGVPKWFLDYGFAPPDDDNLAADITELRAIVFHFGAEVVRLAREVEELRGTDPPLEP